MMDCMITFRSVTPAQAAEEALRRNRIRCVLRRTPGWLQEKGCGYSLQLSAAQVQAAVEILRGLEIGFRKVYLQTESGKGRELAL